MLTKLKHFITTLLLGANFCSLSILWVCCLSTYISPGIFPKISLLWLTFPILLAVNIGFAILWFFIRPKFILVPLLGVLIVGCYVLDYYPINPGTHIPENAVKVISFNAAGLSKEKNKKEFIHFLKEEAPDIICFQELGVGWFHHKDIMLVLDSMRYTFKGAKNKAIMSRLPFLSDTIHINYPSESNSSIACWIDVHGDSTLIVNNHLESYHLSKKDREEYNEMLKEPNNKELIKTSGIQLMRKLAKASKFRGPQTDSLCTFWESKEKPSMIMCGDYNDTPISYTYQKLSKNLTSVFRESGNGIGISYNEKGFFVRIDHIFITEDWESCKTYIDTQTEMSDHNPLVTYLRKKQH